MVQRDARPSTDDDDQNLVRDHPTAPTTTSDADTILLTSRFQTEVGTGFGVRLELVAALDGSSVWVREHRRFVVSDPTAATPSRDPTAAHC